MQKKIIALAIASALTVPALAFADATVYGVADLSYDRVKSTAGDTTNQLVSNASRLGVKGSEALDGGNTFVWQMEGTVGMDGSTNNAPNSTAVTTFSTYNGFALDRDTFIGVASASLGTVVLGQHDTPYKMATRGLDVFADSAADNRSLMGNIYNTGLTQDARLANVVAYISPEMGGLTVAAASEMGAENATAGQKKGSAVSLAGLYSAGPIYVGVGYQTITFGDTGTGDLGNAAYTGDKDTAFKVGGSFKTEAFVVNAVVEQMSFTPLGGSAAKNTNIYVAGQFNINATDAVKAAITKQGDIGGALSGTKSGSQEFAVGYDHGMSKATTVYALFDNQKANATNSKAATTLSFGIKHAF